MALKIKRFDASKHFESPEAQARLIDDALQSGNTAYIANAIGVVARARGMSGIAKETGLSRQALYSALSENGNPSLDTIMKVTKALGVELHAGPASASTAAKSADEDPEHEANKMRAFA
jgi:probable addiction module antidote protein